MLEANGRAFLGAPLCSPAPFHSQSQGTCPRGRTRRTKVESKGGASGAIWDPLHLVIAAAVLASVGRVPPRSASPGSKSPAWASAEAPLPTPSPAHLRGHGFPRRRPSAQRAAAVCMCSRRLLSGCTPASKNNLNLLSASCCIGFLHLVVRHRPLSLFAGCACLI